MSAGNFSDVKEMIVTIPLTPSVRNGEDVGVLLDVLACRMMNAHESTNLGLSCSGRVAGKTGGVAHWRVVENRDSASALIANASEAELIDAVRRVGRERLRRLEAIVQTVLLERTSDESSRRALAAMSAERLREDAA